MVISKDSFIDIELESKYSDMLYSVKLSDNDAYIYFLFEHKSKEDKFVALQLQYMVEIWYMHVKQNKSKSNKKLPVIIPMLIYHGKKEWSISEEFIDLVDGSIFKEYIPNFKYEIFDISHLKDEDIKGSVFTQIAFLTMKHIFTNEINEELPKILKLYSKLSQEEKKSNHLDILLKYIMTSAK